MRIIVDIIREHKQWNQLKFISKRFIHKIIEVTLSQVNKFQKCKQLEVAILLCNNEMISSLNNEFRNKNSVTNVLSFPDRDLIYSKITVDSFIGSVNLGDIAMSFEVIDQEAKAFNISFENHFTHLLVHAILHLVGYDHKEDVDAEMMENLEITILKEFHIKKPPIYD